MAEQVPLAVAEAAVLTNSQPAAKHAPGATPTHEEALLYRLLDTLEHGHLLIRHGGQEHQFGRPATGGTVCLTVHDDRFFGRVLHDGDLGLGESYMDGWWNLDDGADVSDLLELVFANQLNGRRLRFGVTIAYLVHSLRKLPTRAASLSNVHDHYDLGNDFFSSFLDRTMTYSCGFANTTQDSLEQMQLQKYEIICRKLDLRSDETLLDIGCGWGGLLAYAGTYYGIKGLGVTLSPAQAGWAERSLERLGLADRINVKVQDYRDVVGSFDKVVSVGMFEHVGRVYQQAFLRTMARRLAPGGRGLLHTMGTVGDRDTGPWLRRYVFPGTSLPRLEDLCEQVRGAGLRTAHLENWKPHYARTARLWSRNFSEHEQHVRSLGSQYDDRFIRMWHYYLELLVAAFQTGDLQLYQLLFTSEQGSRLPIAFDFSGTAHPNPDP